jgi:hypothetical protein
MPVLIDSESTGNIPREIGNCTYLMEIHMENNNLTGTILCVFTCSVRFLLLIFISPSVFCCGQRHTFPALHHFFFLVGSSLNELC